MRVCPRCKYIDPPYWKHVKWSYYVDACSFENFTILHPELAKKMTKGGALCEDEDFYYRVGKNRLFVERKAKVDFCDSQKPFKNLFEKGSRSIKTDMHDFRGYWTFHPSQTKLTAFA